MLGGGFGCVYVRSWCWLDRTVLKKLDRGRLLGLLPLRMINGFELCLQR